MATLITGATGYLGSYALTELLAERSAGPFYLLTRGRDRPEQERKLWRALQLHLDPAAFRAALERVHFVPGDLTADGLGIPPEVRRSLPDRVTRVLHIAASLNRRSARECTNVNLRGTLSVLTLAREIAEGRGGLDRFTFVSTTAVAGDLEHRMVAEDEAVDWSRRDYDPYARTKKLAEHMCAELLPGVSLVIVRPSAVVGDSRFAETTQFEMVRAYCFFVDLPAVPLDPRARQELVNADFVGRAMARLHLAEAPRHRIYHLSSGASSPTAGAIGDALARAAGRSPRFVPALQGPFRRSVDTLANGPRGRISRLAGLLSVFLPYVTNDVVFDNRRVVDELRIEPVPFTAYCGPLYRWAKRTGFIYPYRELPTAPASRPEVAA
ncbi:MAG: SDR family oxidoreductase [Sandaracinaceae bacterium]